MVQKAAPKARPLNREESAERKIARGEFPPLEDILKTLRKIHIDHGFILTSEAGAKKVKAICDKAAERRALAAEAEQKEVPVEETAKLAVTEEELEPYAAMAPKPFKWSDIIKHVESQTGKTTVELMLHTLAGFPPIADIVSAAYMLRNKKEVHKAVESIMKSGAGKEPDGIDWSILKQVYKVCCGIKSGIGSDNLLQRARALSEMSGIPMHKTNMSPDVLNAILNFPKTEPEKVLIITPAPMKPEPPKPMGHVNQHMQEIPKTKEPKAEPPQEKPATNPVEMRPTPSNNRRPISPLQGATPPARKPPQNTCVTIGVTLDNIIRAIYVQLNYVQPNEAPKYFEGTARKGLKVSYTAPDGMTNEKVLSEDNLSTAIKNDRKARKHEIFSYTQLLDRIGLLRRQPTIDNIDKTNENNADKEEISAKDAFNTLAGLQKEQNLTPSAHRGSFGDRNTVKAAIDAWTTIALALQRGNVTDWGDFIQEFKERNPDHPAAKELSEETPVPRILFDFMVATGLARRDKKLQLTAAENPPAPLPA